MNDSMNPKREHVSHLTVCENEHLHQARITALDSTATALQTIIKQHELTEGTGERGLQDIEAALNSAEDALFYLATASTVDDIDKTRELLKEYGREDLRP